MFFENQLPVDSVVVGVVVVVVVVVVAVVVAVVWIVVACVLVKPRNVAVVVLFARHLSKH